MKKNFAVTSSSDMDKNAVKKLVMEQKDEDNKSMYFLLYQP